MRWPDYKDFAKNSKYRAARAPADFIALYKGTFIAIECKSTIGNYFRMEWLQPHQAESLLNIKKAGGISYLAFSHRGNRRDHKCWLVDISDYLYQAEICRNDGRKSVPLKAFDNIGISLKNIKIRNKGMKRSAKGWALGPVLSLGESLPSYNYRNGR